MVKRETKIILVVTFIVAILAFFVLPKTGFTVLQSDVLTESDLENLRQQAKVECLQNSQCSQGYECVDNFCIEKNKIDLCQSVKLSTGAQPLEVGKPINSAKRVLTRSDLPYLLSDGELVKIEGENITKYFYSPVIIIGENVIDHDNGVNEIRIKENTPIYKYKMFFSNYIDFSDKDFHGQSLRILGKEYIIGSNSNNEEVELISTEKTVNLKDENNLRLIKNNEGKVESFEVYFNPQAVSVSGIKEGENFSVNTNFNPIDLKFNAVDSRGFADISIGGNC